jgi:septal ring factor EnvC (AmiA/AmiB activator)
MERIQKSTKVDRPLSHVYNQWTMTRYKKLVWTGLLAGALLALPYAASADPRGSYRRGLKNEIQQDRRELRDSRQEFKSDLEELKEDRREYRQDRRSGASNEELARDKAEIRESLDNLRDSRREVEQDQRELNRNLNEYDWRSGDRDRDDRGWWGRSWW